jgi:hypothetical protein
VIVPIYRKDEERAVVLEKAQAVADALRARQVRVHIDSRDHLKPGPKFYEWERKGVPVRIEIGPRDVAQGQLTLVLRDAAGGQERKESRPRTPRSMASPAGSTNSSAVCSSGRSQRREQNSHRGVHDYAACARSSRTRAASSTPAGAVPTRASRR